MKTNKMKRSLAFLTALILMSNIFPIAAFAAENTVELDIGNGSIIITETGYSQNGGAEVGHTGDYAIKGTSTANTVGVKSGEHNITLKGLDIQIPVANATDESDLSKYCAFAVSAGAKAELTLQNDNLLVSTGGFAGLYVAEDAALTIDGTGALTAQGGNGPNASGGPYGSGAGIGGNGHDDSFNIGDIMINNGNVTAMGGDIPSSSKSWYIFGAGAGIGIGGTGNDNDVSKPDPTLKGTITINGGVVTATGGEHLPDIDCGGGAGIGSGGIQGSYNYVYSEVAITISNGKIAAQGGSTGAGIGGGNNTHSGTIHISGGEISAVGGNSPGTSYGGAGIGSGGNYDAQDITIEGDAKVTAIGGGASAGIGAGYLGGVWDANDDVGTISIGGNSVVTAWGGTGNGRYGAGIGGSGRGNSDYQFPNYNAGIITISDEADVTAYAGPGASALGIGSNKKGVTYDDYAGKEDDAFIIADKTVSIKLFNCDTVFPAYIPNVSGDGADLLVAYTMPDGNTFPLKDTQTDTTVGTNFEWSYDGTTEAYELNIFDKKDLTSAAYTFHSENPTFGNWAILATSDDDSGVNIYYDANGGAGTLEDENNPYTSGTEVTILSPDGSITKSGYKFSGWNTEKDGSGTTYKAGDKLTLTEDTTLYAQWEKKSTSPTEEKYVVKYHANGGTGTLTDKNSPYNKNDTVTILSPDGNISRDGYVFIGWNTAANGSGKDYKVGYEFNITQNMNFYAKWKKIENCNVFYDANGGTGTLVDTKNPYMVGDKVIVLSPLGKITNGSKRFIGWSKNPDATRATYFPGSEFIITEDTTLYAIWLEKENPENPTDIEDPLPPLGPWELNLEDHYNYLIGYPDGTVKPTNSISREEATTVFFRLLAASTRDELLTRTNDFEDVAASRWSNAAISTLASVEIVRGYPDGSFNPKGNITRAEFAAIASRFDTTEIPYETTFKDTKGHWAEEDISRAAYLGWIKGNPDGTFRPDAAITRAEVATFVNRMLLRVVTEEEHLLSDMKAWPDNQKNTWYYYAMQEATNSHDYNRVSEDSLEEDWISIIESPDWKQYER